jgi:hypothetical protein
VHGGVPCAGALSEPAGRPGQARGPVRGQWHRRGRLRDGWLGRRLGLGRGAQAVVVRGDGLLRRLAHVLPQVEPVGDLDRLRGSGADALGVGPGPVSAHSLDLGVLLKPGRQRAGLAVGQHVHRLMGAHVDQDGVVGLAAADREVIDTEDADRAGARQRLGADEADQHVAAARHGRLHREPGPGPAGQRERDLGQRLGQRRGAAGERRGQPRNLLGERGLPAPGVEALEPADARDHQCPAAADRKVGELTLIAGVDPGRAPAAPRARRVGCLRPDPERHPFPVQLDAVDHGRSELRQKLINVL